MAKHSHREQILNEGLRVVHQLGFAGASVRDIVRAAGVPQGSFTNHFVSKEAFGLEILNRYFDRARTAIDATLCNDALSPMKRLRAYVDAADNGLCEKAMRNGCLLGNFSIEASEHSEVIRTRVVEIFDELKQAITQAMRAAVKAGELAESSDCAALADFFLSALQGATLRAKAERSPVPLKVFKKYAFSTLLAPPAEVAAPVAARASRAKVR